MILAMLSVSTALAVVPPALAPNPPLSPDAEQACRDLPTHVDQLGSVRLLRRLDQLPPGHVEHAVYRTVFGCPVAEIVMGGQTYYLPSIVRRGLLDPAVGNRIARHDTAPGAGDLAHPERLAPRREPSR